MGNDNRPYRRVELRLTHPLYRKLAMIAAHEEESVPLLCHRLLEEYVTARLQKLTPTTTNTTSNNE